MNKPKFLKGQCDLFLFVPSNQAERFKELALKTGVRRKERDRETLVDVWQADFISLKRSSV